MISQRILPKKCAGYFRKMISLPDPVLEEMMNLDLEHGTFFSFLPQSVIGPWGMGRIWSESVDFSYGVGLRKRVIEPFVIELIFEYLQQSPNRLVISLAPDQNKSLFREDENANCFFINNSVYYYAFSYQFTRDDIEGILRDSEAFEMRVAFTSLPTGVTLGPQKSLPERVAKEIVSNIKYLIVGAFDDEWIIIWDRKADPDRFLANFSDSIQMMKKINESDAIHNPLGGSNG